MALTLLIVDDNPDDRELVRRALAQSALDIGQVLEAEDSVSCAAQVAGAERIDCILLDYSLPGRNGLKVLGTLMEKDPLAAVVMITGQGDEAIAVQAMKNGAQDYLTKDVISASSLERAVSNATERARMQRKIAEQQESLKSFAHILVHDLRAPLRAVQQSIEMLSEDLSEAAAAENVEMLEFVAQGARRMDALITALQTYNEADLAPPAFEPVSLTDVLQNVMASLQPLIVDHRALIRCDSALPVVEGNTPQLEQLFQNLIGNGIKYNRSDPPVIQVTATGSDSAWQIEVSDNGIGIDTRFLDRIFEPFKRLHSDGEFEGTGLGLATCRKIAERHRGRLSCRSTPGEGSVFCLSLPRNHQVRAIGTSDMENPARAAMY